MCNLFFNELHFPTSQVLSMHFLMKKKKLDSTAGTQPWLAIAIKSDVGDLVVTVNLTVTSAV